MSCGITREESTQRVLRLPIGKPLDTVNAFAEEEVRQGRGNQQWHAREKDSRSIFNYEAS